MIYYSENDLRLQAIYWNWVLYFSFSGYFSSPFTQPGLELHSEKAPLEQPHSVVTRGVRGVLQVSVGQGAHPAISFENAAPPPPPAEVVLSDQRKVFRSIISLAGRLMARKISNPPNSASAVRGYSDQP